MAGLADRGAITPAIRTLLTRAIDYAGLFPPAALPMDEAVRNYASYRDSTHGWALGRLVVPVARLEEFREAADALPASAASPWPIAAVAGAGGADDWPPRRLAGRGDVVDALELRVGSPDEVHSVAARLPRGFDVFYEVPIERDPAALVAAIARSGGKAKVRTGGVTADAFPEARDLARFVVRCVQAAVPFKATAGLHHPLRATYRLTYAADSPRGDMFGFLNILLAAVFARAGLPAESVAELLAEREAAALRFGPAGVEWRGRHMGIEALTEARSTVVASFGSCSFLEPIEELEDLGLL